MDPAAYWHSLRYQQPRQIGGRARYWLGRQLYPRLPRLLAARCANVARGVRPRGDFAWRPRPTRPEARATPDSLLGQFQAHYFDWAPESDAGSLTRQIDAWIDANAPGSWPAWHPYPTSLRIVNWIRATALGLRPAPRMIDSLAQQAAFLERNLEFHLGGNHLLENARALLVAGLYFEGPAAGRWRATALKLLRAELAAQVLPDGGHFERSPFYHHRALALALDAIDLLTHNGYPVPPEIIEEAERMTIFARALRHPDGSLPLFHDALSAVTVAVDPGDGPASFPDSGYYLLDTAAGRLIADYGAPADCYNPGHQHAGIFSFEVSSGPQRIAVDSGTSTYEPGPERDRLRSTAAHNTVRVDGQDQFQLWDAFRVGRRAWVSAVDERHASGFSSISAAHDGYRRLGVEHRRTIVSIADAGWLIVDDLSGRGSHGLESFLHLAPGITPQLHPERICLMPLGWVVQPFGCAGAPEVFCDRIAPAIGVNLPAQTLVLRGPATLPARFGYFLGPETVAAERLRHPAALAEEFVPVTGKS